MKGRFKPPGVNGFPSVPGHPCCSTRCASIAPCLNSGRLDHRACPATYSPSRLNCTPCMTLRWSCSPVSGSVNVSRTNPPWSCHSRKGAVELLVPVVDFGFWTLFAMPCGEGAVDPNGFNQVACAVPVDVLQTSVFEVKLPAPFFGTFEVISPDSSGLRSRSTPQKGRPTCHLGR